MKCSDCETRLGVYDEVYCEACTDGIKETQEICCHICDDIVDPVTAKGTCIGCYSVESEFRYQDKLRAYGDWLETQRFSIGMTI